MTKVLGSHSTAPLSGRPLAGVSDTTDAEWVYFDLEKAGPDRYQDLRRMSIGSNGRRTLPSLFAVSNFVADALSDALSQSGVKHQRKARTLQVRGYAQGQEDRWVEVNQVPVSAWKDFLGQATDYVRSQIIRNSTYNINEPDITGVAIELGIDSLGDLADAYLDFFKKGLVSYESKRTPNGDGIVERLLIARVKQLRGQSGGGGGGSDQREANLKVTFRSKQDLETFKQRFLVNEEIVDQQASALLYSISFNPEQAVVNLRDLRLVETVSVFEGEGSENDNQNEGSDEENSTVVTVTARTSGDVGNIIEALPDARVIQVNGRTITIAVPGYADAKIAQLRNRGLLVSNEDDDTSNDNSDEDNDAQISASTAALTVLSGGLLIGGLFNQIQN